MNYGWEPTENDQKQQKPTETEGPCPDLKGFCIKARTLCYACFHVFTLPPTRATPEPEAKPVQSTRHLGCFVSFVFCLRVWPGGQVWSRCGDRGQEIRTTRFRPENVYRKVSVDRNTSTETTRKTGRKPKEHNHKPQKPTETQGPCPDLRGFCISALSVRGVGLKTCNLHGFGPQKSRKLHVFGGGRRK